MSNIKALKQGDFEDCLRSKAPLLKFKNIFYSIKSPGRLAYSKYLRETDLFKCANPPILKFHASFDNRGQLPKDRMKFRSCHILFYVEDGTIKVYEPTKRNAGYEQGRIINRIRIPKPEGDFYTLDDFIIGVTVIFFGKIFKLLDCDGFTRNFLHEMGFRVNNPDVGLKDPVVDDREQEDSPRTQIYRTVVKDYKRAKFQADYPKHLRFFGIYQRNPTHIEDQKYVSMYYSLSDGTVKIVEDARIIDSQKNRLQGNFDTCLVLKSVLVPKSDTWLTSIGTSSPETILNLGSNRPKSWMYDCRLNNSKEFFQNFLLDCNSEVHKKMNKFYVPSDFELGSSINVFGAKLLLYDCDDFTKQYYSNVYNVELKPLTLPEIKLSDYHKLVHPQQMGSFKDSLKSCYNTEIYRPLPSSKDFIEVNKISTKIPTKGIHRDDLMKFYLNNPDIDDCKILRFLSVFTHNPMKKEQRFIIEFHMEDDTVNISEQDYETSEQRMGSAKYLKRVKLSKPVPDPINYDHCFYSKADMYVGNTICARTESFYLLEADEYTYTFMEKHSNFFIYSDIKIILELMRKHVGVSAQSLLESFEAKDACKAGVIPFDLFRLVIRDLFKNASTVLNEQQIITLARAYAEEEYTGLIFEDIVARVQAQLKKHGFQDFDRLKNQFQIFDINYGNRTGLFQASQVYRILVSSPIPADRDLIKAYLFKFPKSEGLIDYRKIMETLDFVNNPAKAPNSKPYVISVNWSKGEKKKNMQKIIYRLLIDALKIEDCFCS
ncbi:EF-hand domain-containing family member C2-like [Parasteatoda tepidariorum]|uniref:EF-hand domain-containing family member C2-like n=1 Tax=Parasteatoda tepidariorum TaxID=114398 RepID=UPI00077FB584|nr:EF-hand domain-containing family member C2-like [Parasteatoda tepidariorum]